MKYEFWLKNESIGGEILLPVTPEGYEISYGMEIETVRATNIGDINVYGRRKPQSIKIEGFFTVQDYDFKNSSGGGFAPTHVMAYVNLIRNWITLKSIVRLIIAEQTGARVNERFYIEELTISEKKEDNGDIPFSLQLLQYTPLQEEQPKGKKAENNSKRADVPPKKPNAPKTYTVKKGDCLYNIARQFYGNPNEWKKIYNANKGVIGKNPNLIYPGQKYTIP